MDGYSSSNCCLPNHVRSFAFRGFNFCNVLFWESQLLLIVWCTPLNSYTSRLLRNSWFVHFNVVFSCFIIAQKVHRFDYKLYSGSDVVCFSPCCRTNLPREKVRDWFLCNLGDSALYYAALWDDSKEVNVFLLFSEMQIFTSLVATAASIYHILGLFSSSGVLCMEEWRVLGKDKLLM